MTKKKKIIAAVVILLAAVFAFSAYKLGSMYVEQKKIEREYEGLRGLLSEEEDKRQDKDLTPQEKYASVYRENNDFVGWVSIDDTPLDYPVVQTKDEPEYYLRRSFQKEYSYYGVPFMDYKCDTKTSDNLIIYGHNMTNKTMFSAVESYADKEYWQEHRYIKFDTMDEYATYEVVCSFRIDVSKSDFYFNTYTTFYSESVFNEFMENAKALATYDTGVTAEYGDKLLTLSTCEYNYEDGRYVVVAKKLETPVKAE